MSSISLWIYSFLGLGGLAGAIYLIHAINDYANAKNDAANATAKLKEVEAANEILKKNLAIANQPDPGVDAVLNDMLDGKL